MLRRLFVFSISIRQHHIVDIAGCSRPHLHRWRCSTEGARDATSPATRSGGPEIHNAKADPP